MGEAILVGGRMGAVEQKIYKWKQYQAVGTNTYYWNRYNRVSTTTYKWNKWSRDYDLIYTWNKWSVEKGDITLSGLYTFHNDYNYTMFETCRLSSDLTVANPYVLTGSCTRYGDNLVGLWYSSTGTGRDSEPLYIKEKNASQNEPNKTSYNITKHKVGDIKGTISYGTVTSHNDGNAYPNPGVSGSYWYCDRNLSMEYTKGSTSYGQVTSTSSSAYPSNGVSGSYWYESAGSTTSYSKGSTKYSDVSSTNRSAYPDNSYSGSYWYVYSTYKTSWSQGTYVADRLSTDRDRWPDNGKDGDYWYVFDGEA